MEESDALGHKSHDDNNNNSDSEKWQYSNSKKINLYNRKEYIRQARILSEKHQGPRERLSN